MSDLRFIVLSSGVLFVVICLGLLVMDAVIGGRLPPLRAGTGALVFDGAPTGLHPSGFDPTIAGGR